MKQPTEEPGVKARRRAARAAGKLDAIEFAARLRTAPRWIREMIADPDPERRIVADPDGMIDPSELDRIRAKFPCKAEGCRHVALGPSGYCHDHKAMSQLGRERTPDGYLRTPEQRERISEGMRGKPRPWMSDITRARWEDPEQREALLEARKPAHDERSRMLKAAGRLTADVAASVGRSPATVTEHVRRQRATTPGASTAWSLPGVAALEVAARPAYIWSKEAEREYRRWLAKHSDGRLQWFAGAEPSRDPRGRRRVTDQATAELAYANWCKSTGQLDEALSDEVARAVVRPIIKARRSVLRSNAGRPRSDDMRQRCLALAIEVASDLRDQYERDLIVRPDEAREATLSDVLSVVASLDREAGAGGWKSFRSRKSDVDVLRWLLRDELETLGGLLREELSALCGSQRGN